MAVQLLIPICAFTSLINIIHLLTSKVKILFNCQYAGNSGFPGDLDAEEFACNEGDLDLIPELGKSLVERHGNPFQYSCLKNPHGQRIPAGYHPRGRKESNTTEGLSTPIHSLTE